MAQSVARPMAHLWHGPWHRLVEPLELDWQGQIPLLSVPINCTNPPNKPLRAYISTVINISMSACPDEQMNPQGTTEPCQPRGVFKQVHSCPVRSQQPYDLLDPLLRTVAKFLCTRRVIPSGCHILGSEDRKIRRSYMCVCVCRCAESPNHMH